MTEQVRFGEWLRKQRRALDLSRQALASQIGCAEITLRRIEEGTLKPSKELASILLEKVGIPQNEREQWTRYAREQSEMPASEKPIPETTQTNLPALLTSFIGRDKEQGAVIHLLEKHRLVTLVGPGGIGKTRLSLKVGEQKLSVFGDGVWLVELAPLNNPELIPQTIASIFGINFNSSLSVTNILISYLRAKTALLILDNCEHLLEACVQLTDTLLKQCPHLKVLATSRELLGILGEASYPVPSLGVPDTEKLLDAYRDFESVRLFEERAQLARFDFSLTMENASSVAQICHRLDGIPLAIELAAVQVSQFSPAQIATQLNDSFKILTGGNRAALPRHQTLRASMDWSWGLLSEAEQIFLRQLSVFAGGWTLESVQAVCDGDASHLVAALMNKSLVAVEQDTGHETRYHFHEVVRQYACERLAESGEEENIRTRHLKYFTQFSEQIEPKLHGPQQAIWHVRAFDEADNVRTALQWADKTNTEAGLYLSSRLDWLWYNFNIREGSDWLSRFLQKPESHNHPTARVRALYSYGGLLIDLQQLDPARLAAEEVIELSRALGDQRAEVDGLLHLTWSISNPPLETKFAQQAFELAQILGDVSRQISALWRLGWLDSKHRFSYWERVIALVRSLEDWHRLANVLSWTGLHRVLNGEIESAQRYLDEADLLYKKLNLTSFTPPLLSAYGQIALIEGNFEKAREYFQKNARLAIEHGDRTDHLWDRAHLGYVALREGKLNEALQIFSETAQEFQSDKYAIGVAFVLEGMAGLCVATNKPAIAAQLIGWADETRKEIHDPRPRLEQEGVDKIISACLAKMGEVAFSDAYEEGEKMTMEQAIELALEETL